MHVPRHCVLRTEKGKEKNEWIPMYLSSALSRGLVQDSMILEAFI